MGGQKVVTAVFDFSSWGGSMGMAVAKASSLPRAARGIQASLYRASASGGADAGRRFVVDANAAHDYCRERGQGGGPALHRRADRPPYGRRNGVIAMTGDSTLRKGRPDRVRGCRVIESTIRKRCRPASSVPNT